MHQLTHCFRQNGTLRLSHDVSNHFSLFRRGHTAAAHHRIGRSRLDHGFFLHFQNFFLRFDLRLRHGFCLRRNDFRLRQRRRGIIIFYHNLRRLRRRQRASLLYRSKQRRQRFIGVFLRISNRFGNQTALYFRRVLL